MPRSERLRDDDCRLPARLSDLETVAHGATCEPHPVLPRRAAGRRRTVRLASCSASPLPSSCAGTTTPSTPSGANGRPAVTSRTTIPGSAGRSTVPRSWSIRRGSARVSAASCTGRALISLAGSACGASGPPHACAVTLPGRRSSRPRPTSSVSSAARVRDPTLSFQLSEGFQVLAVVSGYLRNDAESQGHAAIIEWLNPTRTRPAVRGRIRRGPSRHWGGPARSVRIRR